MSLIPDPDICLFRFRDRQNNDSEDAPLLAIPQPLLEAYSGRHRPSGPARVQMELMLTINWPYNRETGLDYPDGTSVITRVLKNGGGS